MFFGLFKQILESVSGVLLLFCCSGHTTKDAAGSSSYLSTSARHSPTNWKKCMQHPVNRVDMFGGFFVSGLNTVSFQIFKKYLLF